ncbi:MAG: hypothetical protein ACK53Y_19875, partial [bacterium]
RSRLRYLDVIGLCLDWVLYLMEFGMANRYYTIVNGGRLLMYLTFQEQWHTEINSNSSTNRRELP